MAATSQGRSAHSTAPGCAATCPRKPGWTLLSRAAAGSSRQCCIQGQGAGEHHPPSGRKEVGHDHVFRHSGYVREGDKAQSPGRYHPETPQHAATHLCSTSTTLVPPFETNTDKTCFSRNPKHRPDDGTPWYSMTLHGNWFRQDFSNMVNSIFHA